MDRLFFMLASLLVFFAFLAVDVASSSQEACDADGGSLLQRASFPSLETPTVLEGETTFASTASHSFVSSDARLAAQFIPQCRQWLGGLGNLPVFNNQSEVTAEWAHYFQLVYGEVPSTRYPICVGSFWFLDEDALKKAGITKPEVHTCPESDGDVFKYMNKYQPPWSAWIRHPPPFGAYVSNKQITGVPANTWVEVTHQRQDREVNGAWFMFSMGSGVWFNTGKTKVYENHGAAQEEFCGSCGGKAHKDAYMAIAAAKLGYSSLQFTAHGDDQWRCKQRHTRFVEGAMGIEILGVKLKGDGDCGKASSAFRAGWAADKPCDCDPSLDWLNCKGYGSSGSSASTTN